MPESNQSNESQRRARPRGWGRRKKGAPNPMIPCGCKCGEQLEKFDVHGRPRTRIAGHGARALKQTVPGSVLKMLLAGVSTRADIARSLSISENAAGIALTKLRSLQLAEPVERGRWQPTRAARARAGELSSRP